MKALSMPHLPRIALSQGEFVALMAMLSGTIAFSIDAMLPALPEIAAELSPDAPNRTQLIISMFMLGLGLGTLLTGSLSDALGRKPVMIGGAVVYCLGALMAWAAPSIEWLLAARVLQGLGAAGPRVVAMAMVRDLYSGPVMARIMSFVMLVFTLVPTIAPSLGAAIIWGFGWRQIFLSFLIFSAATGAWLWLRQPETLAPAARRKLSLGALASAAREMAANQTVRLSALVQALCFTMLLALLSSVQPMFDTTYGQGANFPLWFGAMALIASTASMLNARLVIRLGMRRIIRAILAVEVVLSLGMVLAVLLGLPRGVEFALFFIWVTSVFFMAGMSIGNLNALAMEPLGHIAGKAASLLSAFATVIAVALAAPIGQSFDGTPLPIAAALCLLAALAFLLTTRIKRPGEA